MKLCRKFLAGPAWLECRPSASKAICGSFIFTMHHDVAVFSVH